MKLLYIDTSNSGISGDMFLAAILGLIESPNQVVTELKQLMDYLSGVSKLEIDLIKIERSGFQINQLKIEIREKKNHRTPKVLRTALNKFMEEKTFSTLAKNYATRVLNSLIQAEALVHDKLEEKLHLHELSSVDTLVDIIGVTRTLDILNVFTGDFRIYSGKLPLGGGIVQTAHGTLAVPAPATSKIIEKSELVICGGPIESELVTPTGAALLANLNPKYSQYSPKMTLIKLARGTGQKKFNNFLNTIRIFHGERKEQDYSSEFHPLQNYKEKITVLETDVDDVSGELLGNFINNLELEDILDIQVIPSTTKKNRPGHVIKVLCHPENKYRISEKIIRELGTLGVRMNNMSRVCISRKIQSTKFEIEGKTYEINCKISFYESEKEKITVNIKPEYEDLRKISKNLGLPLKTVQFLVNSQIKDKFNFINKSSGKNAR